MNLSRLREAAGKATSGRWWRGRDWHAGDIVPDEHGRIIAAPYGDHGEDRIATVHHDADAEYIAQCAPEVVVALVDAFLAAKRWRENLRVEEPGTDDSDAVLPAYESAKLEVEEDLIAAIDRVEEEHTAAGV
jgi:hypothetical protein